LTLSSTSAAHPADGGLHDVVEDVALEPREQRRHDVHREDQHEHVTDGREVHALPGHQVVRRGDHRGLLVVALLAQVLDDLLLGGALGHLSREVLAEDAGEDQVGGTAEDAWAERHQADALRRERDDGDRLGALGRHPAHEPLRGRDEVAGLLTDHATPERATPGSRTRLDALGLLQLRRLLVTHAAASSALSWDATISWYVGAALEQLVVPSAPDDDAVLEDEDQVGVRGSWRRAGRRSAPSRRGSRAEAPPGAARRWRGRGRRTESSKR
jgi:hypothetical protein